MKNSSFIGLIVAIDYEINDLSFDYQKIIIGCHTYFLINNKYILVFSGIGKVNASSQTTALLNHFNITQIINIGSSGTTNSNLNVFDVNIATKCQYGDVDVTCDPKYAINQMPYEPKYFETNDEVNKKINNLISKLNYKVVNGTAITVDSFVTSENKSKFYELDNNDVYTFDMESCAIAQVCYHYKIPFNCLKLISDNSLVNNSHSDFEKNMPIISEMIKNIILEIIKA